MAADSDNMIGLYVIVPIYFVGMFLAAVWAYFKVGRIHEEGKTDDLAAHYLGGRGFGPLLTAGTMFASLFSGYTVVGVPNEAFRTGWRALRWMPTVCSIVLGYMGTGPRLRKVGLVRNHQSPTDFVTDRYQSQILRYTILVLQLFPSIIYISAQVVAIKGTFNSIFDIDPDSPWPVVIIMCIILLFEWMGGLNSVALTDSIQGIIMVITFVALPIVLKEYFGGWRDLDPFTYPQPKFYQNPTGDQQWLFWNFVVINFGFFSLPHLVQRTYAASSMAALKMGYVVLTIGPWLTMLPGIFMGTLGVQILEGQPTPGSPFTAILEEVMDLGGFPYFIGVVAFTSSLAAIMSTADSLIIAISHLLTTEILYPFKPDATPTQVTIIGKVVSCLSVIGSLMIGLYADQGISELAAIQFGVSLQTIPAFLFGLFSTGKCTDAHPWSLASGGLLGAAFTTSMWFGYMDKPERVTFAFDTGVMGLGVNLGLIAVTEVARRALKWYRKPEPPAEGVVGEVIEKHLYPDRPEWDKPSNARFGDVPLTPRIIWGVMSGFYEPLTKPWFCILCAVMTFAVTPLVVSSIPPLDEAGNLAFYPGEVNGIPAWAFKIMMFSLAWTLMLLLAISWIPNQFPLDEKKVDKEGIDPNFVELTTHELNMRTKYDEANASVKSRRSTLVDNMLALGISLKTIEVKEEEEPLMRSNRRLSALVTGRIDDQIVEEEDSNEEKEQALYAKGERD